MKRKIVIFAGLFFLSLFLVWRFVRPMNIFVVSEAFERPVSTADIPASFKTLRAEGCGACHAEFYVEWATTMHSRAWSDPYFQVDRRFDRSQQICKNCHTPLDRQQEDLVLGFRDRSKWNPILTPNPDFDPELQHEGVTCAGCHLREGKILGPYGSEETPHPVAKLQNSNQICLRCHIAGGKSWDTFYRIPPCGTVAEIGTSLSGEIRLSDIPSLRCVECHMPLVERPLVAGGDARPVRRHLWRGGHDPDMVKRAMKITLREDSPPSSKRRHFILAVTNVGAAHYLPTGTPDRHLTVQFRLLDAGGKILKEQRHTLKRTILWRPFIVELWDTRLPYKQPRTYRFDFTGADKRSPASLEVVVRYHLLDEARRRKISYENKEPISYEIYREIVKLNTRTLPLTNPMPNRDPHETCVVETGIPHLEAKITRNVVAGPPCGSSFRLP